MSVLEIWGAEYQENDCLLIKPESRDLLEAVCARERCLMQVRLVVGGCWCWSGTEGGGRGCVFGVGEGTALRVCARTRVCAVMLKNTNQYMLDY